MLKFMIAGSLLVVLVGCGGLRMTSITTERAAMAHQKETAVPGYIVYHPLLVVTLKEDKGTCKIDGKPTMMPDYSKPFLLEIEPGLSNTNVDLRIEDGWRLGGATSKIDNTGWVQLALQLGAVAAFNKETEENGETKKKETACRPGLNGLVVEDGKMRFEPLLQ